MKADQAREIAFSCLAYPYSLIDTISAAAQHGNFKIYWPKRDLSDWAIEELKKNGYQVIERAFEYEINWDE